MERRRKMDAAGCASIRAPLIRITICLLVISCTHSLFAAQVDSAAEPRVQQLLAAERWQEVVNLVGAIPNRSADLDYAFGTALAHLGRWDDARHAFEAGSRLAPHDTRFPTELAGVAFKQKNYGLAKRNLRRALRIGGEDSYANDFLGTIYFLEG